MAYRKNITPEQKAKSEARRAKFRAMVKQVAAMSDAERQGDSRACWRRCDL